MGFAEGWHGRSHYLGGQEISDLVLPWLEIGGREQLRKSSRWRMFANTLHLLGGSCLGRRHVVIPPKFECHVRLSLGDKDKGQEWIDQDHVTVL